MFSTKSKSKLTLASKPSKSTSLDLKSVSNYAFKVHVKLNTYNTHFASMIKATLSVA